MSEAEKGVQPIPGDPETAGQKAGALSDQDLAQVAGGDKAIHVQHSNLLITKLIDKSSPVLFTK